MIHTFDGSLTGKLPLFGGSYGNAYCKTWGEFKNSAIWDENPKNIIVAYQELEMEMEME